MIFATEDTHGNFLRFSTKNFPEQKQMSRNDYVIICGDFGGMWDDSAEERYWLDWLNEKPFTTLWIDGYTFFAMGGAKSHDTQDGILDPNSPDFKDRYRLLKAKNARSRILRQSWWPEEMPSESEYQTTRKLLESVNWEVDYLLTHCAPTSIGKRIHYKNTADPLTNFFEEISKRLKFHYWLFGHYHGNQIIEEKYVLLWEQILQIL